MNLHYLLLKQLVLKVWTFVILLEMQAHLPISYHPLITQNYFNLQATEKIKYCLLVYSSITKLHAVHTHHKQVIKNKDSVAL